MAVRSGRRSGRASATILRKDAVEDVPPGLDKREMGRRRERTERGIGGEEGEGVGGIGDDGLESDGGVRGEELATKER